MKFDFTPLREADLPMLLEWLNRPHLRERWGPERTLEEVREFVRRLFRDPEVTEVRLDPHPENRRAIRCYEKAGFARAGEIETPDGPALLMCVVRETPAADHPGYCLEDPLPYLEGL